MGIKHFFPWLLKRYPRCISSFPNKDVTFDILAIDMNGLFHDSIRNTYSSPKSLLKPKPQEPIPDKVLFSRICRDIEYYISLVKPKKKVYLCIDGVAGNAKMFQQRQRRYRAVEAYKSGEVAYNSNFISPGTEFMDNLSRYIHNFLLTKRRKSEEFFNLEIIFSNEKVPGEGEHKIMNMIRSEKDKNQKFIVIGNDADIVMLCMALNIPSIYILRKPFDRDYQLIDVSLFSSYIKSEMGYEGADFDSLIDDFIFLFFMMGNDFLPNIPFLEIKVDIIESLFISYSSIKKRIVYPVKDSFTFSHSLKEIISYLASLESTLMLEKYKTKEDYYPDDILNKSIKFETIDINSYKNEYYQKANIPDIKKACFEYLKGMEWIISYYKKGISDWKWYYPYYYSPFLSDILNYFDDYLKERENIDKKSFPVSPFLQLLCILPPSSSYLLPSPLSDIPSKDKDDYPDNFTIDLSGKKYDYEAIVILPFLNLPLITEYYSSLIDDVSDKEKKRNIKGKVIFYPPENPSFIIG